MFFGNNPAFLANFDEILHGPSGDYYPSIVHENLRYSTDLLILIFPAYFPRRSMRDLGHQTPNKMLAYWVDL